METEERAEESSAKADGSRKIIHIDIDGSMASTTGARAIPHPHPATG
jgi:hypothetical protein